MISIPPFSDFTSLLQEMSAEIKRMAGSIIVIVFFIMIDFIIRKSFLKGIKKAVKPLNFGLPLKKTI
ncbi:MAG: hypothetical protein PQ275_28920 [Elizabethkingia anophelis]|nr:MAG: hypothetical protein PQ275_28920 [Elizabethkingia anophelis]